MKEYDERVDAYIDKSAEFAEPILDHLRSLVHESCPSVKESIKWGFPFFDYKGPLCSMAAFKAHCAFTFWKGTLLGDPHQVLDKKRSEAMGHIGKITSPTDLPNREIMIEYLHEAMLMNEQGIKLQSKPKSPGSLPEVPDYFLEQLRQNPKASETFQNFSNSHRKEYITWITEAKTEATRIKRIQTSLEWLSEGKSRHWKHIKK